MGFQLGVWGLVFIHPVLYKLWPCWAAAAALNGMVRRDLKWDAIDRSKLHITKGLRAGSPLQVFVSGGEAKFVCGYISFGCHWASSSNAGLLEK